jgi:type IV secretory pathway VirB10-like protein
MSEADRDLLDIRPTAVARPPSPWVVPLSIGGVVAAGLLVFAAMSAGRAERQAATATPAAFEPAPPPLDLPVATPPEPLDDETAIPAPYMAGLGEAPPAAMPTSSSAPGLTAVASALDQRRRAPAVIVDLAAAPAATAAPLSNPALGSGQPTAGGGANEDDEGFARRLGAESVGAARSSRIDRPDLTAPQGTIVPAVLETAISSDLPGFVRAVVSREVRAFDGRTVVIPRGSKLIGQYRSAVAAGQSRAFVVWTRLIRPDGVTIDLASPGADALGRGGLEGRTDQHFLQRFGAAILLSVISAGTSRERGDTVVIGTAADAGRIAEIALQKQIDIPPTIKVAQGTPIRVFVARDLIFETAARP